MKILFGFIAIVIALWCLWFFTGGPAAYEASQGGKYIKPPPPLDTGEVYDATN